jgi:hypothetical protein
MDGISYSQPYPKTKTRGVTLTFIYGLAQAQYTSGAESAIVHFHLRLQTPNCHGPGWHATWLHGQGQVGIVHVGKSPLGGRDEGEYGAYKWVGG